MKNKIIALLCILTTFAFPICGFANVDDVPIAERINRLGNADVIEEKMPEYLDSFSVKTALLRYIGALDGIENILEEQPATKGFAATVAAGIAVGGVMSFDSVPFPDVSKDHVYADGIYTAYQTGILPQNKQAFYPNQKITAEALSEMLIKAVGPDSEIYVRNGSYLSYAASVHLFDGIDLSKNTMTNGDVVCAAFNALNTVTQDGLTYDSSGQIVKAGEVSKENYLYKRFHIVELRGIVTGIGNMSLYGDGGCGDNEIEINRMKFLTGSAAPQELFGNSVIAYVDKGDDENMIAAIFRDKKTNLQTISAEDIYESSAGMIRYYDENGIGRRISVDSQAQAVKNDAAQGRFDSLDIKREIQNAAQVTLIDNTGDEIADVVVISAYTTYVVDRISAAYNTITYKYSLGNLVIEDEEDASIYLNGEKISFDELKKSDVLTVLKSTHKDGRETYRIYVSREVVRGVLESIEEDAYVVDGKRYKLSAGFCDFLRSNQSEFKPVAGQESAFYLSSEGEIAASENESGYQYGYLMAVDQTSSGVLAKGKLKIYSSDGTAQIYELSDKVTLMTETATRKVTDEKEIFSLLVDQATGAVKNMMVAFKAREHEIYELVLEKDNTGNKPGYDNYPIRKDYQIGGEGSETKENRLYTNLLEGEYNLQKTDLIIVPSEQYRNDERFYRIAKGTGSLYGTQHYFVNEILHLYNADKFFVVGLAVIETKGAGGRDIDQYLTPVMISKVSSAVDGEGNIGKRISYFSNGVEVKKFISDSVQKATNTEGGPDWVGTETVAPDDLSVGDIIQFTTNEMDEIDVVRILFKYNNSGSYRYQSQGEPAEKSGQLEKLAIVYGKVADVKDNVLLIDVSDDDSGQYIAPATITAVYGANTYTILDKKNMKVSVGSRDDIMPGDKVVLRERWFIVCDVFIIKE